ncbi:hypothetical protein AAW31_07105 [Nitrosomonas communis]|uniref:Uncharacterized protein n=2 Tax=Nitrosomonas communis TaxID=44574 RepID=A0A0F7KDK2_9PROT|nr:hypothetical protein AAW31_07105 [Nitrosomonas communis]
MRDCIKTRLYNVSMVINFPRLSFSECSTASSLYRYPTEVAPSSKCLGRDAVLGRVTTISRVMDKATFMANDVIDDGFNHYYPPYNLIFKSAPAISANTKPVVMILITVRQAVRLAVLKTSSRPCSSRMSWAAYCLPGRHGQHALGIACGSLLEQLFELILWHADHAIV